MSIPDFGSGAIPDEFFEQQKQLLDDAVAAVREQQKQLLDDAVAAERERCAKLCDAIADEAEDHFPSDYSIGLRQGARECAEAIRKGE